MNINERFNNGHKAISQIKSLLNDADVRKFAVQTGLLLRDSTFVSKMLLNSEVWHSLTKSQIEDLGVKQNFPGQNRNSWCTFCGLFPETQSHLLQCPAIVPQLGYLHGKTSKLNENLVYGNINQQQINVKIFSDILEVRENVQKEQT